MGWAFIVGRSNSPKSSEDKRGIGPELNLPQVGPNESPDPIRPCGVPGCVCEAYAYGSIREPEDGGENVEGPITVLHFDLGFEVDAAAAAVAAVVVLAAREPSACTNPVIRFVPSEINVVVGR